MFCDDGLKFGPATAKALGAAAGLVARAAKAERFTGKSGSALELIVPEGLKVARLVVIGAGKTASLQQKDLLKLGGLAMGKLPLAASEGHGVRRIAERRAESRTGGRPGAGHACCALMPSTATRPSARTTRSRRPSAA